MLLAVLNYDMRCIQLIIRRNFTRPRLYVHSRLGEYVPQDEEPGNFPFPKKQIPKSGQQPFCDHIAAWRRRWSCLEDQLPAINIGLPAPSCSAPVPSSQNDKNFENDDSLMKLEAAARRRSLIVPIDEVEIDYDMEARPSDLIRLATKYGLFRDLFGAPHFFTPWVPLRVYYNCVDDDDMVTPVFAGNHITPQQTGAAPTVRFAAPADGRYTLLLTSLDSNVNAEAADTHQEVLHWMVTNLQADQVNGAVSSADEAVPYLAPIPSRGTGYHRLVFLLFRQDSGLLADAKERLKVTGVLKNELASRSWSTKAWYGQLQDELTPAGLSFFQTSWDGTVRQTFRDVLNLAEPCYEHAPPVELPEPEQQFAHAKSFNKYLDTYRDTSDIAEEVLRQRLADASLDGGHRAPPLPFPLAEPVDLRNAATEEHVEEWREDRRRERAGRRGYWRQLEPRLRCTEEEGRLLDLQK